jgi:hypothetical protein
MFATSHSRGNKICHFQYDRVEELDDLISVDVEKVAFCSKKRKFTPVLSFYCAT